RRLPRPSLRAIRPRQQSGFAMVHVATTPAVEQRSRDPELPAGFRDVPRLLRPLHDFEPQRHYTLGEGHEAHAPFVVCKTTNGECRTTLVLSEVGRTRLHRMPVQPRSRSPLSSRSWVSALKLQTLRPNRTG